MLGQAIITDALGKVHHFKKVYQPYACQGGGWVVENGDSSIAFGPTYVTMEWIPSNEEDNDQKADD